MIDLTDVSEVEFRRALRIKSHATAPCLQSQGLGHCKVKQIATEPRAAARQQAGRWGRAPSPSAASTATAASLPGHRPPNASKRKRPVKWPKRAPRALRSAPAPEPWPTQGMTANTGPQWVEGRVAQCQRKAVAGPVEANFLDQATTDCDFPDRPPCLHVSGPPSPSR